MQGNKKDNTTFVDRILEILTKQGVLKLQEVKNLKAAFEQSAAEQFDYFLLSEGLVEKSALLGALSTLYKVPAFDVTGAFFDHLLLTNFPKDFLLRNAVIPLELDGDELVVVAAEPDTPGLEHALRRFTENDIVFMVGLRTAIGDAVKEFYDKAVTEDIPEDVDIRQEQDQERAADQYVRRKRAISRSGDDE